MYNEKHANVTRKRGKRFCVYQSGLLGNPTHREENFIPHFNPRSPFLLKAGHTHTAAITDVIIYLRSERTTLKVASQSAERISEQWKVEQGRIKMENKADS